MPISPLGADRLFSTIRPAAPPPHTLGSGEDGGRIFSPLMVFSSQPEALQQFFWACVLIVFLRVYGKYFSSHDYWKYGWLPVLLVSAPLWWSQTSLHRPMGLVTVWRKRFSPVIPASFYAVFLPLPPSINFFLFYRTFSSFKRPIHQTIDLILDADHLLHDWMVSRGHWWCALSGKTPAFLTTN